MVEESRPATRSRKITVLLSPEEFRRFTAYCQEKGYKKSTLIVRLIKMHLAEQERLSPLISSDSPQLQGR